MAQFVLAIDDWAKLDHTVTLTHPSLCYIHRVPKKLIVAGEDKYEPHTISIGPYHCRKTLEITKNEKKVYLHSFLERSKSPDTMWKDMVNGINGLRNDARRCYSDDIGLSDEEFVRMLILDGCFILELLHRFQDSQGLGEGELTDDILFNKSWIIPSIRRDLVLLENQIPLSVLVCLFGLIREPPPPQTTIPNNSRQTVSFKKMVTKLYGFISRSQSSIPMQPIIPRKTSPLYRLIASFFNPILPTIVEEEIDSIIHGEHLLDLLRKHLLLPSQGITYKVGDSPFWEHTTCAVDLQEAGVNFKKKCDSRGLLDISFSNGKFEIPPFYFGESWTILFPNIIALEQCRRDYKDEITSYAILVDNLINSHSDVKLLREKEIIGGSTKEDEKIAQAVNSLCKNAIVDKFYYDGLCSTVNAYRKTTIHTWRAAFMRKFIHTPWAGVSVLAAISLLGLTVAQTVFDARG